MEVTINDAKRWSHFWWLFHWRLTLVIDAEHHRLIWRVQVEAAGDIADLVDRQSLQAQLSVSLAPLADSHARQAHALGDRCVRFARIAGQHDLGALDD